MKSSLEQRPCIDHPFEKHYTPGKRTSNPLNHANRPLYIILSFPQKQAKPPFLSVNLYLLIPVSRRILPLRYVYQSIIA
jgi:hypothetical protein